MRKMERPSGSRAAGGGVKKNVSTFRERSGRGYSAFSVRRQPQASPGVPFKDNVGVRVPGAHPNSQLPSRWLLVGSALSQTPNLPDFREAQPIPTTTHDDLPVRYRLRILSFEASRCSVQLLHAGTACQEHPTSGNCSSRNLP